MCSPRDIKITESPRDSHTFGNFTMKAALRSRAEYKYRQADRLNCCVVLPQARVRVSREKKGLISGPIVKE